MQGKEKKRLIVTLRIMKLIFKIEDFNKPLLRKSIEYRISIIDSCVLGRGKDTRDK